MTSGVPGSGLFVTGFGARPVISAGVSSLLLGVPVIALSAQPAAVLGRSQAGLVA